MDMDHLREIGQISSQKHNSSSHRDTIAWAVAGVSCLALLVAVGFFAMSYLGSSSVQASAGLKHHSVKVGNKRPDNLYAKIRKRCKQAVKHGTNGDPATAALERHIDRVGQIAGARSSIQEAYTRCMLAGSSERFCSPNFKAKAVDDIKAYISSGSNGRLMTAASEPLMNAKSRDAMRSHSQTQRTNFRTKNTIIRKVRILIRSGYLDPDDFSHVFWGTPDWVQQIVGQNYQKKNPCS